jgi:hypothetical protein
MTNDELDALPEHIRIEYQRIASDRFELLHALKKAEWIMRSHIMPEHFDGYAAQTMEAVRAAIAKAEAK